MKRPNWGCHHKPAVQSVPPRTEPCTDHHPNCCEENYTLRYFIPASPRVINAVVSCAALQTHTESQRADCLSASAVSSTSFRSESVHLQFFSRQLWLEMCCLAPLSACANLSMGNETHTHTHTFLCYPMERLILNIHPSLVCMFQSIYWISIYIDAK